MARIIKPPAPIRLALYETSVFLAGSIEGGVAENWQTAFERKLGDLDVVVLNPRRDNWNATWTESIQHVQFREQVEWELEGQERADLIVMYFAPSTRSSISLLELGLFARSGKMIVCCPDGFWKKGNVDVVCKRYGVKTASSLEGLIEATRKALSRLSSTLY